MAMWERKSFTSWLAFADLNVSLEFRVRNIEYARLNPNTTSELRVRVLSPIFTSYLIISKHLYQIDSGKHQQCLVVDKKKKDWEDND